MEAAEQFLESHRLSGRTVLLLNAATAYERAQEWERAAEVLERYLAESPEAEDRATVETRLVEVRRMADQSAPPATDEGDGIGSLGVIGITLVAVGAAAGVASIVTGVVAADVHGSLEERCGPTRDACPPGYQSDVDLGQGLAIATDVLWPTALVAAGVGATLLILDLSGGSGDESAAALVPGPGDVGLAARIRF